MTNKLIMLKKLTKVEFYEGNYEMSKKVEDLLTIALWEFS